MNWILELTTANIVRVVLLSACGLVGVFLMLVLGISIFQAIRAKYGSNLF